MSYVYTNQQGEILSYPYNLSQLKLAQPNVSFPVVMTDATYADYNVYPVRQIAQPKFDAITQNISEIDPLLVNDGENSYWTQRWLVTQATNEEIASRIAVLERDAASEAARRLADTDKYVSKAVVSGLELHADLINYRTALEQHRQLAGYPVNVQWPDLPENIFEGDADLAEYFDTVLNASAGS
jgi:hypothetical protein